jgi:hypothetical protein
MQSTTVHWSYHQCDVRRRFGEEKILKDVVMARGYVGWVMLACLHGYKIKLKPSGEDMSIRRHHTLNFRIYGNDADWAGMGACMVIAHDH